jgi:uncharacterized protein
MGDTRFLMGSVHKDTYEAMFAGPMVKELVQHSIIETLPGCSSCVYCPYCGTDPVRNYSDRGDIVGRAYRGESCQKNMALFDYLFSVLLSGDTATANVFWSWATKRPLRSLSLMG